MVFAIFLLLFNSTPVSPQYIINVSNNKNGTEVPNANIPGRIIPYEDDKTSGINKPKKSKNIVGQNPSVNIMPNKKEDPFPFIF